MHLALPLASSSIINSLCFSPEGCGQSHPTWAHLERLDLREVAGLIAVGPPAFEDVLEPTGRLTASKESNSNEAQLFCTVLGVGCRS